MLLGELSRNRTSVITKKDVQRKKKTIAQGDFLHGAGAVPQPGHSHSPSQGEGVLA